MQAPPSTPPPVPRALAFVNWSFFVIGVAGLLATLLVRDKGLIVLHGEMIGLLIFVGLRFYSWHARTLALLILLFWLLLLPLAAFGRIVSASLKDTTITTSTPEGPQVRPVNLPYEVRPFGIRLPKASWVTPKVAALAYGCLFSSMFVILLRRDVRYLFMYGGKRQLVERKTEATQGSVEQLSQ